MFDADPETFATIAALLMAVVLFAVLYEAMARYLGQRDDENRPRRGRRGGRDMDFSAGRDAAQQKARLRQVFVPMDPQQEPQMRQFYLGILGLMEMRSPNYAVEPHGFWAVSGRRQIYVGPQAPFAYPSGVTPAFPIANLDLVADDLEQAGFDIAWDSSVGYVDQLLVVDPSGNEIALIRG